MHTTSGTVALTGVAAKLVVGHPLIADTGALLLVGNNINLVYAPGLMASPSSIVLSGKAVKLPIQRARPPPEFLSFGRQVSRVMRRW